MGAILFLLALVSAGLMFTGLLFPRMVIRSGLVSRGRVIKRYASWFAVFLGGALFFGVQSSKSEAESISVAGNNSASREKESASVSNGKFDVQNGEKAALALKTSLSISAEPSGALQSSREDEKAVADMKQRLDEEGRVKTMLQKASGSSVTINAVNNEKGKYRILASYEPEAVWSESSFLTGMAIRAADIAKAMKKGNLSVGAIIVAGYGKYVDRYGNESRKEAMTLEIPGADYEKANWNNMTHWDVLNVSEVSMRPVGKSAAKSFCDDRSNAENADMFCSAVKAGKRKLALSQTMSSDTSENRMGGSMPMPGESGKGKEVVVAKMDLDLGTFIKRVNKDLKTAQYPHALSSSVRPESDGGQLKSARFDLSDELSALVMMDAKTGKLSKIVTITVPSGEAGDDLANATAAVLVVSAPAGRDGEKTVGGPIMRMYSGVMQKFLKSREPESDSFVRSGVRYGVHISQMAGIMVYAEAESGN
ncbi:MAG: hypothetical protein Q4B17_12300 [Lautropia sp.]|nr:hypothetical protein [Lautropia sp.]